MDSMYTDALLFPPPTAVTSLELRLQWHCWDRDWNRDRDILSTYSCACFDFKLTDRLIQTTHCVEPLSVPAELHIDHEFCMALVLLEGGTLLGTRVLEELHSSEVITGSDQCSVRRTVHRIHLYVQTVIFRNKESISEQHEGTYVL